MDMLTQEDLKKIGDVVDERIEVQLEPVLQAIREGFEQTATKVEVVELGKELRGEMAEMRHELMDHTDRTVEKAVGNLRVELKQEIGEVRDDVRGLRSELRERELIG